MLNQALISIEQTSEWDSFLSELSHAPAHTSNYNRAMMLSSRRPTYLYVASAENFIAACPVAIRHKFETNDLVTPYGFGGFIARGEYADFPEEFDSFMREQEILSAYLAAHPYYCRSQSILRLCETMNANIYLLDLKKDISSLFSNLAKTHRYEIRQLQDADIVLLQSKEDILFDLLPLYRETLLRTDAASVYYFDERTLSDLIADNTTLAFAAREDDKTVAITLIIYNSNIAGYFINAANVDGRKFTRNLLWKAVEYLHDNNIPLLNLGGGIRPDDNLDQFKRRFPGNQVTPHVLKRIYDENLYHDVCRRANIESNKTHYFPAYHAVNLEH